MTRLVMYVKEVLEGENRISRFISKHIETIDTICAKGIEILALIFAWYIIVKSPKIVDWIFNDFQEVFNFKEIVEGFIMMGEFIWIVFRFILKVILFIPSLILKGIVWLLKDLIVSTIEFIKWIF